MQIERRTVTVQEVASILGVGRNKAYEAARSGEIPTIRIGRRLLVPLAAKAKDRQAVNDQIDRHTTAAMLGITIRTLQRWYHENYGPKRRRSLRGRICYKKGEVEAWVAEHGQGSHRPRSKREASGC
jgi:excisionase family DNA binding protein